MMFNNMFYGRYGIDKLFYFLFFIGIILNLIPYTQILGILCFIFAIYRAFSRNIGKRRAEAAAFDPFLLKLKNFFINIGNWFVRTKNKVVNKFRTVKNVHAQRKSFKFFKCPNCKNKLRLPSGKGKLKVSCPVCKHKFIKKT